jgi:hypothetical protein
MPIAALLIAASSPGSAQVESREYQKKAEFICSFARFVEWPSKRFSQPDAPFVIGVFGMDGVSDLLREAIQNRRIKDRPVVIKHLTAKEEIRSCHVLFVSRSERDRLGPVLGEARRESTLTVGECDNFLARGGVINFLNVNGEVRFQISPDAASRERLKVSSKLLQIALPTTPPGAAVKLSEAQRP